MPRNFEATFDEKTKTLNLRMFGIVAEDFQNDGTYVDATKVAAAIADHQPAAIHLAINSRGGDAFHGIAIYELLKKSGAKTKGTIYGLCASVMTVIIAACDEVEMNAASLVMLHESGMAAGGRLLSADLRLMADVNDKINEAQIEILAARTGKPAAEIQAMLAAETWFTAKEALSAKLITSISPAKTIAAAFQAEHFSNVPAHILPLLAALQLVEPAANALPVNPDQGIEPMTQPVPPTVAPVAPVVEPTATAPVATVPPAVTPVAPTAVAPPAAPPVDPLIAERDRTTQINAACRMAGHPELADQYIRDATPLATVQASLLTVVCAGRAPTSGAPGSPAGNTGGEDAAYKAEFAQFRATYDRMGTTEEEYIKSRRFEDGKDVLHFAGAR